MASSPRIEEGFERRGCGGDDLEMCALPVFWLVDGGVR